jgi:hypothetical protein
MRTLQSVTTFPAMRDQMDLAPIKAVLGDNTPHITPDALGRHRLNGALKQKFGASFRNHPQAASAIRHFEQEHSFFKQMRSIKGGIKG